MDESGYTGEDLMNSNQPFFTLATLCSSEQECQAYKSRFFSKVKAPELKHKILVEGHRQRLILEFLKELCRTPELVKIHVTDKRYAVTENMINYIVKPAAKKAGIDLRIKGRDYGLTYFMYTILPLLAGQSFFEDLLQHFQNMMICLDHESYQRFFDPLFDERYPQLANKEEQKMLDYLLWHIKEGRTAVGYDLVDQIEQNAKSMGISHSRPLDPAFSAAIKLLASWQRDGANNINLIYDASSRMAEMINLLHTFIHPFPPPHLLPTDSDKTPYSIIVGEAYARDSKSLIGLQLTDILAGATACWIKWLSEGRKSDDSYGKSLDSIIPLFKPSTNKPVGEPTLADFEELGLTEEEAQIFDDFSDKVMKFHRMRKYGYFRMFSPEELSELSKPPNNPNNSHNEHQNPA